MSAENGYFELGHQITDLAHGRVVRNPETPGVWDSNCVTRVRAESLQEIDALLAEVEREFVDVPHRSFKVDPQTPTGFEARLVLEGYEGDVMIHLVLAEGGEVVRRPGRAEIDIRPVTTDSDWSALARLARLDHEEAADKHRRVVWDQAVTDQMVVRKRLREHQLPFFMASVNGADAGYACAWAGAPDDRVGMVEDVFTDPAYRHLGVATALITHGVVHARAGGAGPVMIGAAADDTPRRMYAAMGFRPRFVSRGYVKVDGP